MLSRCTWQAEEQTMGREDNMGRHAQHRIPTRWIPPLWDTILLGYHPYGVPSLWGTIPMGYHPCGVPSLGYHPSGVPSLWDTILLGYHPSRIPSFWDLMRLEVSTHLAHRGKQ